MGKLNLDGIPTIERKIALVDSMIEHNKFMFTQFKGPYANPLKSEISAEVDQLVLIKKGLINTKIQVDEQLAKNAISKKSTFDFLKWYFHMYIA